MVMTPVSTGAGATLIAEAGMEAFCRTEPCDFSTDKAVVIGVATGLEAIVITADFCTVIGDPRTSLCKHPVCDTALRSC